MEIYEVTWNLGHDHPEIRTSTVAISEGYSTVEDIPRIIATTRTGDPGLAYLINVIEKVRTS